MHDPKKKVNMNNQKNEKILTHIQLNEGRYDNKGLRKVIIFIVVAQDINDGDQCPSVTANCPINCKVMQHDSRCQSACSNDNGCPPGRMCCLNSCGSFHCMGKWVLS